MASDEERNLEDQEQGRNLKERTTLGRAYSSLLGQESVQGFSAFTFEEAVDGQIERIEGKGTQRRPNQLDRVNKLEQDTLQAIAVIRKIPPEDFFVVGEDENVNT